MSSPGCGGVGTAPAALGAVPKPGGALPVSVCEEVFGFVEPEGVAEELRGLEVVEDGFWFMARLWSRLWFFQSFFWHLRSQ